LFAPTNTAFEAKSILKWTVDSLISMKVRRKSFDVPRQWIRDSDMVVNATMQPGAGCWMGVDGDAKDGERCCISTVSPTA
jgi:hypothetical protein